MRWKAILHQALWRWSGMTKENVVGLVLNLRRASEDGLSIAVTSRV